MRIKWCRRCGKRRSNGIRAVCPKCSPEMRKITESYIELSPTPSAHISLRRFRCFRRRFWLTVFTYPFPTRASPRTRVRMCVIFNKSIFLSLLLLLILLVLVLRVHINAIGIVFYSSFVAFAQNEWRVPCCLAGLATQKKGTWVHVDSVVIICLHTAVPHSKWALFIARHTVPTNPMRDRETRIKLIFLRV